MALEHEALRWRLAGLVKAARNLEGIVGWKANSDEAASGRDQPAPGNHPDWRTICSQFR